MKNIFFVLFTFSIFLSAHIIKAQNQTLRSYGVSTGILSTGPNNAITDVEGVLVGHETLIKGDSIRTGATVILPYAGNMFQQKVPAAIYVGNGFGKLAGSTQVEELGNLETPIVLTNTLNVASGINALVQYTLEIPGNENIGSVNALVGETNDGFLNDIRGQHVKEEHIHSALKQAKSGPVAQGNVGAGTGTRCFAYKGGIGSSSRRVSEESGNYTVGVLVQANFGGVLHIKGLPIEELLKNQTAEPTQKDTDGSCMIVVATNAPLDSRNLKRLAKRAMLGLARTGGIASNGSGDYVIAFSTAEAIRVPYSSEKALLNTSVLSNDHMSPLFLATIEATEEAIYNALFTAETMQGFHGEVEALPEQQVLKLINQHGLLK
ncbi:P1 family peptidase [Catalinimonas niigatensis]|uniref:P1 family peptidase n=1 Tax=Catalinimonas niigatensis TaxID=1397264 RepID=UPI0026657E9A|nr:P1 family peptidase [Catalinimonas niigatensis]WPP49520.1 P1 family peptidase [Catalinimonas niigatensis]